LLVALFACWSRSNTFRPLRILEDADTKEMVGHLITALESLDTAIGDIDSVQDLVWGVFMNLCAEKFDETLPADGDLSRSLKKLREFADLLGEFLHKIYAAAN